MDRLSSKEVVHKTEISVPGSVLNFYHLTDQEQKKLRSRFLNNKGLGIVPIHPYYQNDPNTVFVKNVDFPHKKPVQEVYDQFSTFLKNTNTKGPPIFFFQSGDTAETALDEVKSYIKRTDFDIYIVPTTMHSPNPRGSHTDKVNSGAALKYQATKNWEELCINLGNLGMTKVVLGGLNFGVNEYAYFDSGCVNGALSNLKLFFKVKLSKFTWPSDRDTIKQLKRADLEKYL